MFALKMTIMNISFWLLLHLGVGFIFKAVLPKTWFNFNEPFYQEVQFEKKLFKLISIKKWKDKLPELGILFGFSKKKLIENIDIEYIDKFLIETCYGETGHLAIGIIGFTSILFNPPDYWLMAFTISVIMFFANLPFSLIQRYNRHRLLKLKKTLVIKQKLK